MITKKRVKEIKCKLTAMEQTVEDWIGLHPSPAYTDINIRVKVIVPSADSKSKEVMAVAIINYNELL